LFDRIGPRLPLAQRAVFANLWLTRGLVIRNFEGSPATNAMVRTTTASTIFQAGTKDNVLPSYARAVINFRILPGDRIGTVMDHVRRVIDDVRVETRIAGRFSAEASPVSSSDSESFRKLERAIRGIAREAIVAPYLVVGVTDARYYGDLSRNVFRFQPVRLKLRDFERMHGIDERIAVRDYEAAVRIYRQIVLNAAGN
jgi:carboxypeptidase PM20D1